MIIGFKTTVKSLIEAFLYSRFTYLYVNLLFVCLLSLIEGHRRVLKKSSGKSSEATLEVTWRPLLLLRQLKRARFRYLRLSGPELQNRFEGVDFVQQPVVDLVGPIRVLSPDQSRRMFSGLSKSGPQPQLVSGWKVWAWGCTLGNQTQLYIASK
jgi:hypothetical protein